MAAPQPSAPAPVPFLGSGLLVKVAANRPLADLELRLFEPLSTGRLRPLRAAFKVEPDPAGASLRIEPTRFARTRLRTRGTRTVRLQVKAPTAPG